MKFGLVLMALAVACGGGGQPASVQGKVAGVSLEATDSAATTFGPVPCPGSSPNVLVSSVTVELASRVGVCSAFQNGVKMRSLTSLTLQVIDAVNVSPNQPVTPPPIASGTYPVPSAVVGQPFGAAFFNQVDSTCGLVVFAEAISGSITLTEVSDVRVSGSFSLTFPDGALEGSFDAPACPVTTSNWCQPSGACGS
jgi:hypothetical protein